MNGIVGRVRALQTIATRATPAPVLVRCAIFLLALVSFAMAYPIGILIGQALGLLVIAAALPAVAPRGALPTFAAVVAIGGWLLSTAWYGEPVALWRLLGLASALYLMHNLCALAAALPYDAVVAPEALAGWVLRALAVVLASAVLAIMLLDLADWSGGRAYVAAAVGGLAVALGTAAVLGWLLRRK